MPDHRRLAILIRLRKAARVTLAQMARACGLPGSRAYESAGAWERGESVPRPSVRDAFLGYLAHTLDLAADRATLAAVWEVLVEEWGWEPLQPADWALVEHGTVAPLGHAGAGMPGHAQPQQRQVAPLGDAGASAPGRLQPQQRQIALPAYAGADLAGYQPAPVVHDLPDPGPLPPGSLLPFTPDPCFVGRAAELLAIARGLLRPSTGAAPPTMALTGPGGIGKSHLAIEFAHRFGQCFPGGVFWVSCASPEAVPANVAACGAGMLLHPHFSRLALETQTRLVTRAWEEEVARLLIFDNCEDEALLARWLPRRGGCRVLITSRCGVWEREPGVVTLPLGLLSRAASVELLRRHCPVAQVREAELVAIASELDDLPLALHLAGRYLARGLDTLGPARYLSELRQSLAGHTCAPLHPSLRGEGPGGRPLLAPTGPSTTLEQTVALSLARLDRDNAVDALAYDLLLRAAWLAPGELIPVELLRAILSDMPDQRRFDAALRRLLDTGLALGAHAAAMPIRLHRLVVASLRGLAEAQTARQALETMLLEYVHRLNAALDEPALLRLQGHLRAVTDAALPRGDAVAAALSYELSRHLGEVEQYAAALAYNQRSLKLRNHLSGAGSLESSANLQYHAVLLEWMGDYPGARPYHEHVLAIRMQALGPEHPETATGMLHVGEIAHALDDYATARCYYEQALAIRARREGADSPAAAELYNNLGLLLNALGELDAALPYARRAVAIWEAQTHPNRSLQAMALNNLGYLYRARGEYETALPVLRRALQIREEVYGPANSYIGVTRNHIGRVHHYQGRYALAVAELEATLELFVAAIGREHPITASTLSNLGMLELEIGERASARRRLEEALDIHRRLLGAEHHHVARGLNRLGLLHLALGDAEAARRSLREALRIRRRLLGDTHLATANTVGHLGMLHLISGRPLQARPLLAEALRGHQARLGGRHPYTARSLLRMGQVHAALGEGDAARAQLGQALAVYTATLGPDHPYTLAARRAAGAGEPSRGQGRGKTRGPRGLPQSST